MPRRSRAGTTLAAAAAILVAVVTLVVVGSSDGRPGATGGLHASPTTTPTMTPSGALFVPAPNAGAVRQLDDLRRAGRAADASLIQALIDTPSAVWFGGGAPDEVEAQVRAVVDRSGDAVPVLVAYNVPGRDCAQYSAGGASDGDAYRAWIEGFASGVADRHVVVILEPDGLALQPGDCGQPDAFDRTILISAAVDVLRTASPHAAVYLDAGHSAWHDVSDMSARLVRAGVNRASGFFLNASNYQATPGLIRYGAAIARCIRQAAGTGGCDDGPAAPAPSATGASPEADLAHFVIDTSRNGLGPWAAGTTYPDDQAWCNPPGRGLGLRPTLDTGVPLLDGYLWIKIPGESDGTCTRGATAGSIDPEWGLVDPAAGHWFPEQALELARLADPPLVR